MQIIKQKSHVSANAPNECVHLLNNLSKSSAFKSPRGVAGGGHFAPPQEKVTTTKRWLDGACRCAVERNFGFLFASRAERAQ
jgi:hypothetical protein